MATGSVGSGMRPGMFGPAASPMTADCSWETSGSRELVAEGIGLGRMGNEMRQDTVDNGTESGLRAGLGGSRYAICRN